MLGGGGMEFPRSADRGLIEAHMLQECAECPLEFPRSADRGLIEASPVAISALATLNFPDQLIGASLKRVIEAVTELLPDISPIS